jgi:hypothetical protein
MKKFFILAGVVLAVVSCSSFAPIKVSAGDQCMRCRRIIQDPNLAGELVYSRGWIEKFRTPACMAKYVVADRDGGHDAYVTDYRSGKFVRAERATYVPVVLDRNTGETDYRAFRLKADADAAARELQTTAVDWQTVVERARS